MTARGKIVLTIIILAMVGFGVYRWWDKIAPQSRSQTVSVNPAEVKRQIRKPSLRLKTPASTCWRAPMWRR